MLNVSDALKKIYRMNLEPIGTKADIKTRVTFGDLGITVMNDRLVKDSFRLTERISEGGDLDFGSCYASMIEFTVADVPEDLNGQRFAITQTVNGTYTVPLGTFTVDSCKRQDDLRFKDIVAYDNMRLFDKDVAEWYNGLSFPITVSAMRASLCAFCGVQQESVTLINDNVRVAKTLEITELSGKEVLRAIAEINGTFAHINRYGKLTFIGLDNFALYPSETLYPADDLYPEDVTEILEKTGENAVAYISSKYEDYTVSAIDGVIVQDDENADGGVTVGTTNNPYILSGNMLIVGKESTELTTIASNLLDKISKVTYTPHETEMIGLPYVEVGDTVLNANTSDKELFVTKRVLTGISSVIDNLSANGNPTRENYGTVQSSEIRKLNGKTMKITKDIDRIGIEIENLATDTNTRFEVADGRITAEITRAQSAEASLQISINGVRSDVSNLASNTSTRFQQTDTAISAEAKRAMEAETQLRLVAEGLRVDVNGKIGESEARSIFSVEIGRIILEAEQINLNGYIKANGNFQIDNNGDLQIVGNEQTAKMTSNGFSISPTDYYGEAWSTNIGGGYINFYSNSNKLSEEVLFVENNRIKIGQKGATVGFDVCGDSGDFTNFSAIDGDFKTLETITLTATAINGGIPLTTVNMGNYIPTNTNQLEGDFRTGANGAYVALANSSGNHFLATTEWVINYVTSKLG